MTQRKALIMLNGIMQEMPTGDTLEGGGGTPKDSSPVLPGAFPNLKFPAVAIPAMTTGDNVIYTVPTGRKAIVFDWNMSNYTGSSVNYWMGIKIGGTIFRITTTKNEPDQGTGHNVGLNGTQGIPIVLNAGESYTINCSAAGLSVIAADIYEFDDTANIYRADIQSFSVGDNTLLAVPTGKSALMGVVGTNTGNNPTTSITGLLYFNASGASRTLGGIWLVPSSGSKANSNLFAGSNIISNAAAFQKRLGGGIAGDTSIVINIDSAAAGQYMFMNYSLANA